MMAPQETEQHGLLKAQEPGTVPGCVVDSVRLAVLNPGCALEPPGKL